MALADWINASRIILHSKGATVLGAAQIEKRDHVGRVKEHTKPAANHGVGVPDRLIGKAYARAEAVPVLLIDVLAIDTRDSETVWRRGIKAGQVVILLWIGPL